MFILKREFLDLRFIIVQIYFIRRKKIIIFYEIIKQFFEYLKDKVLIFFFLGIRLSKVLIWQEIVYKYNVYSLQVFFFNRDFNRFI